MPHPFIAGVAYTMKMLLKILLALLLCSHRTTVANSDSCEKTQCRLVPQTNDLSTIFSTTASERGVRLFYLYVKVNNNTYRPTNPGNKLRPARWAWARDIQEPMLSFSYDYDILSWGLLHHFQVRMMRVWLLDQPSGCLSNLSLPCQDRVIARALLMDVTNDYFLKEKLQKRATVGKPFVVCNIVLDEHDNEWSKLFDGNLVYRCCSNSTKRVGNETSVECGLHVKVSDWLHFFYHVINYATLPMLLFWPAIIIVLPDFLFTFIEEKEDAKEGQEDSSQTQNSRNSVMSKSKGIRCYTESQKDSSEHAHLIPGPPNTSSYGGCEEIQIPPRPDNDDNKSQQTPDSEQESNEVISVDDISPITITRLMRYCTEKSSVICSDYSKLLFLYFILLFTIYYYKLLFSVLYKDHDLRRAINIPSARLEGQLFEFLITTVYFDLNVVIILIFVVVLIFLPLILIFLIKPCDLQDLCSGCEKNPFHLRTDIREHLRSAPRQMFSMAKYFFTGGCFMRCLKNNPVKKISRSALALWTPSARCFRNLLCDCKCSSKYCRCFGIFCKIFVVALCYSILLILSFILFWGAVLAVLITIFVFPFAIAAGLIIFRNLPFCRLFLFAWHVIRQLLTGDPSTRISCLRCTYKDFIDKCEQCFKKCKQCLECEKCDNESQAAAGNGNTQQGNGSTSGGETTSQEDRNALSVFFDFCSLVLAIFWALGVTDIACLSCRFVARMVGFVIVGVFWNYKETIPYITFLYVLMNHTSCYYRSIQSRYKEIKVMISKQPKSRDSGEKIGEDGKGQGEGQGQDQGQAIIFYDDSIRLDLFWFVCNDCKVLPLVDELCLMFVSVVAFACVLFLAVAAIMFLGEEYRAFPDVVTAILQAGAILISGKLPEWVFKKLIKEERFTDDEKIEKQKMVAQACSYWLHRKKGKNPAAKVTNPAVQVQSDHETVV